MTYLFTSTLTIQRCFLCNITCFHLHLVHLFDIQLNPMLKKIMLGDLISCKFLTLTLFQHQKPLHFLRLANHFNYTFHTFRFSNQYRYALSHRSPIGKYIESPSMALKRCAKVPIQFTAHVHPTVWPLPLPFQKPFRPYI